MNDHAPIGGVAITTARLVRLLGVLLAILSVYQLVSGMIMLLAVSIVLPDSTIGELRSKLPTQGMLFPNAARLVASHLREYAVAGTVLALANLVAAIGLLRRRRWACNYFLLWACFVAAGLAYAVYMLYGQAYANAPTPEGLVERAAIVGDRTLRLAGSGAATAALAGIVAMLLLILLLSAKDAAAPPALLGSATRLAPQRAPVKSALAFAVAGLLVPGLGLVGVVLAFVAWVAVQNDTGDARRKWAVIAMLVGAFACIGPALILYRMLGT